MIGKGGVCLGVSEGHLHYICFNMLELLVWVLEMDALQPKWALKHLEPLIEMYHPIMDVPIRKPLCPPSDNAYKNPNYVMLPYGFQDDILFLRVYWSNMCTYNIKTGQIEDVVLNFVNLEGFPNDPPIVIPYYKSLMPVEAKD
ncbi:hypothetical protein AQUCO_07700056v1 [Aquilegia coerulea]|uniref:F-box associated domain-containing protein n=1 Tax=Aquilegia coerulea TaxID=218851 RepID=A0A2G5C8C4_AQUCA|nr:hypothetical protein AQUCO_07700056v1 [Aquilegia coerulea]